MVTSHHHFCKIHPASQPNITTPSLQNTSCKPTRHHTTISVQDILQANQTKHHTSQHHLCKIHPASNHTAGLQSTVSTCSKHHNMISRRNDNFTKAYFTLDNPHTPDLYFHCNSFFLFFCTVDSKSHRLGFTLFVSVCYCLQFFSLFSS